MNFQVPQFIEVEDKIFGPLTFKQFVYLAGGAAIAFMLWTYIPLHFIAVIFIIPVLALALALAFYKVNSRPFINVMESAFRYALNHKLYIWSRRETSRRSKEIGTPTGASGLAPGLAIPKLSQSKLKDLAWSLDVREKIK